MIGGWADRHITSLDEFLEAVFIVLRKGKECGAVGLKDQSAYSRSLSYDVVPRCDAERLFNRLLADPRNALGWPEAKPLDDFLFHQYMRFARDLDLPVQLHTGHMAGVWNRVDKADAGVAHPGFGTPPGRPLRSVPWQLAVRWDRLLFLGKNYPNVALDCCWLQIIDPLYAEELPLPGGRDDPAHEDPRLRGGLRGRTEYSAAHLTIAREVIASALADLVERGWLDEAQAVSIAADWLFNNPNEFFRLGFDHGGGRQSGNG